ncbi:MAG: D-alanyl-D-alanine carboxypeptidase family protein [Alphaproteobacteria bacterium]
MTHGTHRIFPLLKALLLVAGLLVAPDAGAAAKPAPKPRYAAIVVDAATGEVLHAEHPDDLRYPASLTKMMTLFMIFEAIDRKRIGFDTAWKVSAFAAGQSPTKLGLQAGRTISVRDVVLGLITKSANDAAVVAAENLAGSEPEFAQQMTQRARRLGMARTTFRNASGLPHPEQRTTAADLARLSRALVRSFPHHYHLFSTASFTHAGITHHNHNRFMQWYEGADGLKTGYIHASGFNLAASATRGGRRLIGVVMGGPSSGWRDERMGEVMDAAFARRPRRDPGELRDAAARGTAVGTQLASHPPASAPSPQAPAQRPAARAPEPREAAAAVRPGWSIQVGAYGDVGQARRAAEHAARSAPTPLRHAAVDVQRVGGSGKDANLLRARLTGLSPKSAKDACRVLKRQGQTCLVVPPGPGSPSIAEAPAAD